MFLVSYRIITLNIASFTGYWLLVVVTDVSMQRRRVMWRLQRLAQRRLSRRPKFGKVSVEMMVHIGVPGRLTEASELY